MVFHTAVIEDITSDLRTPFDFLLASLDLVFLFHTMLKFFIIKLRFQETESVFSVLRLVAALGVFDKDFFFLACIRVFILITETNTGLYFVDVLSASTTASECIPRDL